MQKNSKFARLVLTSPYFPFIFILLPGGVVFSRFLHVRVPFSVTTGVLLCNNICLLICLVVRLIRHSGGLRAGIRYESDYVPRPATQMSIALPVYSVREDLTAAGYRFDGTGSYGEKRDYGYWGTILLYGGLFLALFFGTWGNLRQFSGTIIKGPGAPIDLSQRDKYYHLIAGPLASTNGLPLLKVTEQTFPGGAYPMGATEIALFSKDGKRIGEAFLDATKEPYRFGGYDFYLNSLLADLALTIKTRGSAENDIFDDAVKVRPLYDNKVGNYSLYGPFTTPSGDDGEVWYDPQQNTFKIALSHKGKRLFETVYQFQAYREKEEGNYVVSIQGKGHWSELHIVRPRHMYPIFACGIIAACGVLLRLLFRPQRVWLEEAENGCRVKAVGRETKRLLAATN